jgi:hypothetical protein
METWLRALTRALLEEVGGPPPPYFSQVFILKGVKVLYFDTLLQVFILKVVSQEGNSPSFSVRV